MVIAVQEQPERSDRRGRSGVLAATVALVVLSAAAVVGAALAPEPVVLGLGRLGAQFVLALGAWLVVGRVGALDLSVGATAGAGAFVGGITASQLGWPALAAVPIAAAAGAVVGALTGVVLGRVGRTAGALATLAVGMAAVGLARAVEVTGGRSGFHAVPLLVGGDRTDLVAVVVTALVAATAIGVLSRAAMASRAAVAVAAPPVSRSHARSPEGVLAVAGGVAGAVVGVGGLLLVSRTGSALVDGFGPDLTALLVLAAALGERFRSWWPWGAPAAAGPLAVLAAVLVLHGPGVLFPLAPLVGTASPLVTTGLAALTVLAVTRPGQPAIAGGGVADVHEAPTPVRPLEGVEATGLAVPAGTVDVEVAAGEVVALTGPNGAGKSTVLARLAGQLADGGGVRLGGEPAPAGVRARAAAGIARGWQQPVDVAPADLVTAAGGDPDAAAWASGVLGTDGDARARAALVAVAARRPAVVLLDEPAALLPASVVATYVRGLAAAGAAVLVVEHRREIIEEADRVIRIDR